MGSRVLETRGIRFNDIPAEQREDLVEARVTGQVGVVEVGEAAIAEADVRRNKRESGFAGVLNTVPILVEEALGVDIRLPLVRGNLSHVDSCSTGERDGRRKTVHERVVPLVKYSDSRIPVGKTRQGERSIAVALGEREVFAVRISKAHVALSESKATVVAATVESLIRRAAHALGCDQARDRICAARNPGDGRVSAGADSRFAGIDDSWIGKPDGYVVSRWTILLEVAWFLDPEERIMRLLTVQSVGLEPFFPSGNPVGSRRGHHAVPSRHQVGNDCLTCQRGRSQTVRFEYRASHNHSGDARLSRIGHTSARIYRNRAGIERGDRVYRSRQAIHQRLIEHVVTHLSGCIARAAGIVKENDIELPKT